ncbi:hypothetical protein BSU00_09680 [Tenacibaculum sp. SG-28]|nr:hypothetical protein BSU00_09680 [Tenacibaculum sp. SG-28]
MFFSFRALRIQKIQQYVLLKFSKFVRTILKNYKTHIAQFLLVLFASVQLAELHSITHEDTKGKDCEICTYFPSVNDSILVPQRISLQVSNTVHNYGSTFFLATNVHFQIRSKAVLWFIGLLQ